MMIAAGPIVRLSFLRVVTTTPLPVAGEHHRVGVLYSHSATTDACRQLQTNIARRQDPRGHLTKFFYYYIKVHTV